MKYFVSYTSKDAAWAHWIGFVIREVGWEAFVHEWEVEAGANIPEWMENRLRDCDRAIAVVSEDYLKNQTYSKSERLAAYWESPAGTPFLIPVVVRAVPEMPRLIANIKRIHLHGLVRDHAKDSLIKFLTPPSPPSTEPPFPGDMQ